MRLRGFLYILTTACMFGLGAVLAKLLGEAFTPFFVSWLALLGGGLFISACQVLRRKPLLPRLKGASLVDMLLLASIGTALPLVCVIVGLPQTSAITGSFLLQLQAPAALLFAMFFLKEKMSWKQLAGTALLLVGSLLVILRDLHGPIVIEGGQGDIFVLIAAVGIGFAYIPGKRLTGHGDVFQINLLRLFVASCFLLPFEVERDAGHDRVGPEEQSALDEEGALIVQQMLPPPGGHELGQDDGHVVGRPIVLNLRDVRQQRLHHRPVRRRQHDQRHASAPRIPVFPDLFRGLWIDVDVHRAHIVRQRFRVAQRFHDGPLHSADRHDNGIVRAPLGLISAQGQL